MLEGFYFFTKIFLAESIAKFNLFFNFTNTFMLTDMTLVTGIQKEITFGNL